jgi:diguanylate cyclase (GGDEF)-like protein
MFFRFQMKIRAWLLVLVALSVGPPAAFCAYTIVELGASQQRQEAAELEQRVAAAAAAVEQRLNVSLAYLTGLAQSDAARRHDLPALYDHAKRLLPANPDVLAITLISPDGAQVFNTLKPFGAVAAFFLVIGTATAFWLAGLPTRAPFPEHAAEMRRQAQMRGDQRPALLFVDLDGFKHINDTLGHAEGDAVLTRTAEILRHAVRDSDIATRLGGDEFVLCIAAPTESVAAAVAERVVRQVAEIGDGVGCSVGVAIWTDVCADLPELMARADAAMYRAKRLGKNRAAFLFALNRSRLRAADITAKRPDPPALRRRKPEPSRSPAPKPPHGKDLRPMTAPD